VIVSNLLQYQMNTLDDAVTPAVHVAPCDHALSEGGETSTARVRYTGQPEESTTSQKPNQRRVRKQLKITHPLQLRVQEERQSLLRREWPAQAVHLDAGYRAVPSGTLPGQSVFDEMRDRLSTLNIFVSDSPVAIREGLPSIVLLCPGFFEQPALVQLLASTVQEAHPERLAARKSESSWRTELLHHVGMTHTNLHGGRASRGDRASRASSGERRESIPLTKRAQTFARGMKQARSLAHGVKRKLSVTTTTSRAGQQLCLFSTERAFAFYIAQCREHAPHLLDAGVFNSFFQKWPPSPLLQLAVGANQLHPLLPAPPSAKIMEELRRGTSNKLPCCIPEHGGAPQEASNSIDAAVFSTVEETKPAASSRRQLMLTRRRIKEGGSSVVLETRRSMHAPDERRSHLGSHRTLLGASGRLLQTRPARLCSKVGGAGCKVSDASRHGLKDGPETARGRKVSHTSSLHGAKEGGESARRVRFGAGKLEEAAGGATGADEATPEAVASAPAEAAPSAWQTWRPASTEDVELRTSAKVPMPRQLPAPTNTMVASAEADDAERMMGMALHDGLGLPEVPDVYKTRLHSHCAVGAGATGFPPQAPPPPIPPEADVQMRDKPIVHGPLRTDDRGSLVHRVSSLFFLPVSSAPPIPPESSEPRVDEFTSHEHSTAMLSDEDVEPSFRA